jgi:hypothetical protein
VGFALLNYHWVFSAGSFLHSAITSGTSNPQLGGPVIRTFQLPPPGVPHIWNGAREPQQRMVELWARNGREFCRKWRLPHHFWVLLHAVNLRHGTDSFTSPLEEGVLRNFSPKKSDGFGRVWTLELGYQRPARLAVDHRSRFSADAEIQNMVTCQELVSCSKHSVLWKLKVYQHSSLASSLWLYRFLMVTECHAAIVECLRWGSNSSTACTYVQE